jgi:hypothetical protein
VNDIIDSAEPEILPVAAPSTPEVAGGTEPGPDDLRWAEEMFEEWQRLLAEVHRPAGSPAVSGSVPDA